MADSYVKEKNTKFNQDFAEWMSQLSPALHDFPLNTLAIPGEDLRFTWFCMFLKKFLLFFK